jgi:uncharacterized protein YigA (DUF484 family)
MALRNNLETIKVCVEENEQAADRIDAVDAELFGATSVKQLFDLLVSHGERIFAIDAISITLEESFAAYYPEGYHGDMADRRYLYADRVRFYDVSIYTPLFPDGFSPLFRGDRRRGDDRFFSDELVPKLRSEALAPIHNGQRLIGVIGFGSNLPTRFSEGYGSRNIRRLTRTIALKVELLRATQQGEGEVIIKEKQAS